MEPYNVSSSWEEAFDKKWLAKVDLGDIGEVRRLLGQEGASLSDDEVNYIRDTMLEFADIAFHWWQDVRLEKLAKGDGEVNTISEGQ